MPGQGSCPTVELGEECRINDITGLLTHKDFQDLDPNVHNDIVGVCHAIEYIWCHLAPEPEDQGANPENPCQALSSDTKQVDFGCAAAESDIQVSCRDTQAILTKLRTSQDACQKVCHATGDDVNPLCQKLLTSWKAIPATTVTLNQDVKSSAASEAKNLPPPEVSTPAARGVSSTRPSSVKKEMPEPVGPAINQTEVKKVVAPAQGELHLVISRTFNPRSMIHGRKIFFHFPSFNV